MKRADATSSAVMRAVPANRSLLRNQAMRRSSQDARTRARRPVDHRVTQYVKEWHAPALMRQSIPMTDYSDATPSHRLSNAERDAAVASLAHALADGRITTEEFTERSTRAKAAVTQADLAPLFADLPAVPPAAPTPPPSQFAQPGPYAQPGGYGQPGGYNQPGGYGQPGPYQGEGTTLHLIRSLAPIVALILFFTFGWFDIAGGWTTSWLWWVLLGVFYIVLNVLPQRRS
ncbi:hypothetical protein GCM10010988_27640 [Cnuibacter physcomitrellae]|nr:hypothetical protein GCM10010988_27640 [Cnuibacter physcomitrellae]